MNLTLKVWRQEGPTETGHIETHEAKDIPAEASFLEMLDIVNERIIIDGGEPIQFDHDCREGICGACSLTINGVPHSKDTGITTCQVHMRRYRDGDTIWIEPFRARAFPIVKDLVVDRTAFDRIIGSGGYISVRTGSAPDANATPFWTNVGLRGGIASVTTYDRNVLLDAVLKGDIHPGRVFTKRFKLDDVQKAYEAMDQREAIKSLLIIE